MGLSYPINGGSLKQDDDAKMLYLIPKVNNVSVWWLLKSIIYYHFIQYWQIIGHYSDLLSKPKINNIGWDQKCKELSKSFSCLFLQLLFIKNYCLHHAYPLLISYYQHIEIILPFFLWKQGTALVNILWHQLWIH